MFISLLEAPEILKLLRQHDKKLSSRFSGTAKKAFMSYGKLYYIAFPETFLFKMRGNQKIR